MSLVIILNKMLLLGIIVLIINNNIILKEKLNTFHKIITKQINFKIASLMEKIQNNQFKNNLN